MRGGNLNFDSLDLQDCLADSSLVQWIYSEIKKQSVIPTAFWYMSSVGSVLLMAYAVYSQSPIAALGQCFSLVVYTRNLVYLGREKDSITKTTEIVLHAVGHHKPCAPNLFNLTSAGMIQEIEVRRRR